ncbi:hypothetical protein Scep_004954 [Stephania cephalantha]|uniref:Uncharacterized protein n=1 Tax=Stephania cephalantha TaxID=152367 RepID=A0AAP0PX28_9MAGN
MGVRRGKQMENRVDDRGEHDGKDIWYFTAERKQMVAERLRSGAIRISEYSMERMGESDSEESNGSEQEREEERDYLGTGKWEDDRVLETQLQTQEGSHDQRLRMIIEAKTISIFVLFARLEAMGLSPFTLESMLAIDTPIASIQTLQSSEGLSVLRPCFDQNDTNQTLGAGERTDKELWSSF